MVEAATTASSDSAGAGGGMGAIMPSYSYFSPQMTRKTFLEDEIKVDYDDDTVYRGAAAAATTNASSTRHTANKTELGDDN